MVERVRRPAPCEAAPYVGPLVLVAFAGMGLQVIAMGYGQNLTNPVTYWFLIGSVLLILVQAKRSRVARGVMVAVAVLGAALTVPGLSHEHRVTVIFVAFVVQVLALCAPPVNRHVDGLRV